MTSAGLGGGLSREVAPSSKAQLEGPARLYDVIDVYKVTYIADGRWVKMMGFG